MDENFDDLLAQVDVLDVFDERQPVQKPANAPLVPRANALPSEPVARSNNGFREIARSSVELGRIHAVTIRMSDVLVVWTFQ